MSKEQKTFIIGGKPVTVEVEETTGKPYRIKVKRVEVPEPEVVRIKVRQVEMPEPKTVKIMYKSET